MAMYHVMKCLNLHMVQGFGVDLCAGKNALMPLACIISEWLQV